MKKFFAVAALIIGVVVSQIVVPSQAQAEIVNVPGTSYYIFTKTVKYDPAHATGGYPPEDGCNIFVECTNIDFRDSAGTYYLLTYKFIRGKVPDKNNFWLCQADDPIQDLALDPTGRTAIEVYQRPAAYKILLKTLEYLPAEDAAQIKAELAQQEKDFSARENTASNPSPTTIENLPDSTKLAELTQAAEPFVMQGDEKYKAKDYSAAKDLFSQAIEKNPYDYHSHDLYARSLYREKSKDKDYDKIIAEMNKAIELAPDNNSKADCYGFLAKVYNQLAMDNLFNVNNKTNYAAYAKKCLQMEQKLRLMR